jgi:hypothetical protein
MCRVVDTVLIDQEAVYAPRQGMTPTARSEGQSQQYELDLLRHVHSRHVTRKLDVANLSWPRRSAS